MGERFRTINSFPDYLGYRDCPDYKFVDWDRYKVGKERDIIGTDGVLCSLVITVYDSQRKTGVLAHTLGLSTSPKELQPDRVIETLLQALGVSGDSDLQSLKATLSGEGVVLDDSSRNSQIVRAKLNELGIKIIGEDLEKTLDGRLVFLHCDTGTVEVYRA
jgi:chemotaxis receptor (MCP) glutamine deamidase CheD